MNANPSSREKVVFGSAPKSQTAPSPSALQPKAAVPAAIDGMKRCFN
jgi:hypothetical protein